MQLFSAALLLGLGAAATAAFEPCAQQDVFNVRMCDSHMCNGCTLEWCMKSCQDLQEKNPECRCKAWPETRKTYSGGDFEGKGKVGDVGDYSKGTL
mmetsp:Transcript_69264/g.200954  ORF Transcript_69264/g.200954 Transcript_69264/m.200954 type:complete len:96 (-) Transcript_69264:51-338(-)